MRDISRCECGSYNITVSDSRKKGPLIGRARLCKDCHRRFYTIEMDRNDYKTVEEMAQIFENLKKIFAIMENMKEDAK